MTMQESLRETNEFLYSLRVEEKIRFLTVKKENKR